MESGIGSVGRSVDTVSTVCMSTSLGSFEVFDVGEHAGKKHKWLVGEIS